MSQDNELAEVQAEIALGLDCEAFMQSSAGRYLQARANQEIETALERLKTVDPTDPEAVRRLQNDVRVAEAFLIWMGEAVTSGEQAQKLFIEAHGS